MDAQTKKELVKAERLLKVAFKAARVADKQYAQLMRESRRLDVMWANRLKHALRSA